MILYDLIILGSGPAGCSAALYGVRAGLSCLVIEGPVPGGQLTTTTDVVNYPGFEKPVQGPWLVEEMKKQAIYHGAEFATDWIEKVDLNGTALKGKFKLFSSKKEYTARSVIICTGSKAKYLGLKSEQQFLGYGVSGCATCDGFFYKNQDVLVVGGGNTAVEEAIFLSRICKSVTLVHRRDTLRAEHTLQNELKKIKNIKFEWNSNVVEVLGNTNPDKEVTGAILKHNDGTQKEIKASGIFIAIGHSPQVDLFKGVLDIDDNGYLVTNNTKTNIPGVFAAGDVQDSVYRQAVTSAGTGCIAALEASWFLSK